MQAEQVTIKVCETSGDFSIAKELIIEYVGWIGFDLSFQDFDNEIDNLSKMYNEQDGGLVLAFVDAKAVGVAGVRRFGENGAEIKRMFVKGTNRGKGIGQLLLRKCIDLAKEIGYESIKLDTTDFMKTAIKLYQQNGFVEIPAYRYNPHEAARYFKLKLHTN
jgi:GNAT superfamily N-acetyltransferase